jgi:hypothetical protein
MEAESHLSQSGQGVQGLSPSVIHSPRPTFVNTPHHLLSTPGQQCISLPICSLFPSSSGCRFSQGRKPVLSLIPREPTTRMPIPLQRPRLHHLQGGFRPVLSRLYLRRRGGLPLHRRLLPRVLRQLHVLSRRTLQGMVDPVR